MKMTDMKARLHRPCAASWFRKTGKHSN